MVSRGEMPWHLMAKIFKTCKQLQVPGTNLFYWTLLKVRLPQQCSTCTAVGPFELFNEPLHSKTEKSEKRNFSSAHKGPKMCNKITASGFCESGVKPLGLVKASQLMVGSRLKLRAFLSLGPLPLKLLLLQRDMRYRYRQRPCKMMRRYFPSIFFCFFCVVTNTLDFQFWLIQGGLKSARLPKRWV